jgi:hypothetical protein
MLSKESGGDNRRRGGYISSGDRCGVLRLGAAAHSSFNRYDRGAAILGNVGFSDLAETSARISCPRSCVCRVVKLEQKGCRVVGRCLLEQEWWRAKYDDSTTTPRAKAYMA